MKLSHGSAIAAIALSAVCVLGLIVLAALHTPAPGILSQLALGAAFAGAGIASPLTGAAAAVGALASPNTDAVSTPVDDVPSPPAAPPAPPAYTAPPGG